MIHGREKEAEGIVRFLGPHSEPSSRADGIFKYFPGAALMLAEAAVAATIGVKAERSPLEASTHPLSASAR